jgi:hypothetical protein
MKPFLHEILKTLDHFYITFGKENNRYYAEMTLKVIYTTFKKPVIFFLISDQNSNKNIYLTLNTFCQTKVKNNKIVILSTGAYKVIYD